MTPLRTRLLAPALAVLALAAARPAAAQLTPADSAEVANHVLTESQVTRFLAAVARMDTIFRANPAAFLGMDGEVNPGEVLTLDRVAARWDSIPVLVNALRPERMTPRDFARLGLVLRLARAERPARSPNARVADAHERVLTQAIGRLQRMMSRSVGAPGTEGLPLALRESLAEVADFPFTDAGIMAFGRALRTVVALYDRDPAPLRAAGGLPAIPASADEVLDRLRRMPGAEFQVDETGMPVENFATWLVMFRRVWALEAAVGSPGSTTYEALPAGVRANVDYYRRNRERMETLRRLLTPLERAEG